MIIVKFPTLEGPVFINPEKIVMISDGEHSAVILLATGDEVDVEGTAAEVVQQLMMETF
jgi:hypothetical protein